MNKIFIFGLTIAIFIGSGIASTRADEIMDRIRKTGIVRIGFREDAIPFAYFDSKSGEHIGFSVDMAHLLAANLSKHFSRKIEIQPVVINTENRIPLIVSREIDAEMGSSTYDQEREKKVDFSLIFFVSETTFMVNGKSLIRTMHDLNGKVVGAAAGTTNLSALHSIIQSGRFAPAEIFILKNISEGFTHLKNENIDALCLDRTLLNVMRIKDGNPEELTILDFAISYEPYAYTGYKRIL